MVLKFTQSLEKVHLSGAFHVASECATFMQQLEMYGLATE